MRTTHFRTVQALLLALAGPICAQDLDVSLKINAQHSHEVSISRAADGTTKIVTSGVDPYVYLQPFDADTLPSGCTTLAFEFFCPDGIDGLSIYYGPPIQAGQFVMAGSTGRAESWMPFAIDLVAGSNGLWTPAHNLLRIDFGRRAGVELQIRKLILRKPTAVEQQSVATKQRKREEKMSRANRLSKLYTHAFTAQIKSIQADARALTIKGETPRAVQGLHLIELAPWVSLGDQELDATPLTLASSDGILDHGKIKGAGHFTRKLPRMREGKDRITSRFALARLGEDKRYSLDSAPRYITDFSRVARHKLKRKTAKTFKGMAAVSPTYPLEELVELGIQHITANLTLTGLLSPRAHKGWTEFQYEGKTWFANPNALNHHDKLIRFASEHGMVVTAILLIPMSNGSFGDLIIHPQADRAGHYAMPNMTSAEGIAAYSAAISLLSRRYAQPGDPHGRITNWVIHNEVDYGWEWTNMGSQPAMLYMDTYMRSMRLVHNLVRRDNPNARVFISLTHNWNAAPDPKWRSYGSLPLLKRLNRASQVEGDFAWGVAFHPYPQSLFRADTWNDTGITDDLMSPLITPKNLHLLGQWMERAESRDAKGKIRGVLLSEQGFHTDDSPWSQRVQGAAFVYIWRKIRKLPMIEAFHNHRWIDHPQEGGLMLGVRTLPTADAPYGHKKFGWEVYRALDTAAEKKVTRFADAVINTPRK